MTRRYDYTPLTPDQFSAALNEVGLSKRQFGRMTGSDPRRIEDWLTGRKPDMPMWVGTLLVALTVPAAFAKAQKFTEVMTRLREDGEGG